MPDKKKPSVKITNEELAKQVFHPKVLAYLKSKVHEDKPKRKSRST